jgi:cyclic pyranopterin phosphate synthase
MLRSDATDNDLAQLIGGIWSARDDRYSELRSGQPASTGRPEMSYLGG